MTLRKSVGERVERFVDETTFHGIKDLASAESQWFRIFWTLVITFCAAFTIFEIWGVISQYLAEPKSVHVDIDHMSALPQLVFCPDKWVDSLKLRQYNVSVASLPSLASVMARYTVQMVLLVKNQPKAQSLLAGISRDLIPSNRGDLYRLVNDISVNTSSISCNGCIHGYPKKVLTTNGVCFLLKYPADSDLYKFIGYMSVFLYHQGPTAISPFPIYPDRMGTLLYGDAVLDIVPKDEIPIKTNTVTTVKLQTSLLQRLSTNKQPCSTSKNASQEQILCRAQCIQETTRQVSNCTWMFVKSDPDTDMEPLQDDSDICTLQGLMKISNVDYFGKNEFTSPIASCFRSCKESCTHIVYISSFGYETLSSSSTNTSTVFVKFENADSVVGLIEMPSYTWDTLLSNIGGQLGLWLGASIMSLLQLIYFLFLQCKGAKVRTTKYANNVDNRQRTVATNVDVAEHNDAKNSVIIFMCDTTV